MKGRFSRGHDSKVVSHLRWFSFNNNNSEREGEFREFQMNFPTSFSSYFLMSFFFQGPPPRPVPPGPFSLFICPFMLIADRGHNRRIYEFLFFIYFSTSFLRSRTWELFIKRVISIVLLVKSEENLLSSSRKSSALFLRGRISSVGVILSQATSSGTTSVVVPGGVLPCPALHFPCRRPI